MTNRNIVVTEQIIDATVPLISWGRRETYIERMTEDIGSPLIITDYLDWLNSRFNVVLPEDLAIALGLDAWPTTFIQPEFPTKFIITDAIIRRFLPLFDMDEIIDLIKSFRSYNKDRYMSMNTLWYILNGDRMVLDANELARMMGFNTWPLYTEPDSLEDSTDEE